MPRAPSVLLTFALLLLGACNGGGGDTVYRDADEDGYWSNEDCDDTDPGIHPGKPESCDGVDNDCDGKVDEDDAIDAPEWYVDADGDGFGDPDDYVTSCESPGGGRIETGDDCDDGNDAIHPDADEVCNEIDDDCDGGVDDDDPEGANDGDTWYADTDGDGYGDSDTAIAACEQPSGHVEPTDHDCDDADEDVHPGADEVCNEIDDDCDDLVDDEDDDVTDATTWYADTDDDSYGDASSATTACEQPANTVEPGEDDDCDDTDEDVHPGADEVCNEIDDDCDDLVDDEDDDVTDATTWYADDDGDGYPVEDTTVEACDPGSGWIEGTEVEEYDCDDTLATVSPGASEICDNGVDDDCDGTATGCGLWGTLELGTADVILYGEAGDDGTGSSLHVADVDGDGLEDLLVGAPGGDTTASDAGTAYALLGPLSTGSVLTDAVLQVHGAAADDAAGAALAVGDVDGDGQPDLAVAAEDESTNGSLAGAVYLLYGPATGTVDLTGADATWLGEASQDLVGTPLHLEDLDGDGYDDLFTGSSTHDVIGYDEGTVYVALGPLSGTRDLGEADIRLTGVDNADYAGCAGAVGDVNDDGWPDLVVGAYGSDDGASSAGTTYVVLGPVTAGGSLGNAHARISGTTANDNTGLAVATGDLDDDGHDDILVGTPHNDDGATDAGATWWVRGPVTGSLELSSADARFTGSVAEAGSGDALLAGDLDADGTADLIIGGSDLDTAAWRAGGAWLLRGPLTGDASLSDADATFLGEAAEDYAGGALATGELTGDLFGDLLIGADGHDHPDADAGAVYLVAGSNSGL